MQTFNAGMIERGQMREGVEVEDLSQSESLAPSYVIKLNGYDIIER